jgi:hypothetical protein
MNSLAVCSSVTDEHCPLDQILRLSGNLRLMGQPNYFRNLKYSIGILSHIQCDCRRANYSVYTYKYIYENLCNRHISDVIAVLTETYIYMQKKVPTVYLK